MQARDSNLDILSVFGFSDDDVPSRRKWLIELRDLIALGQIGIEVILARKDRNRIDLAAKAECRPCRQLHGFLVENRQRTGQCETDRTGVDVRLRAKVSRAAAERLG